MENLRGDLRGNDSEWSQLERKPHNYSHTLYWASPKKISSLNQILYNPNPNTRIQIRVLGYGWGIWNSKFWMGIPFFGYNSDAKSYLVHITSSDHNKGDSWPRPMCWAPTEREESLWNSWKAEKDSHPPPSQEIHIAIPQHHLSSISFHKFVKITLMFAPKQGLEYIPYSL